jgi:hypothetical protein
MTPRKLPLRVAAALLPLALAAGAAGADTLLTLKSHQDAVELAGQSQPAQDTTVEVWVGKDQISRADEKSTLIVRPDEMIVVNHAAKTYTVLDLPLDFDELVPPEMKQMAAMFKLSAEVTPTEERKKIGDWNVRRYDIEMTNPSGMAITTVMWTTKDLDLEYPSYEKLAAQTMAMAGGAELAAEMAKLEGFPVLQETTIDMAGNTVKNSEELVSVEKKDPPAGVYAAPEGYTESEQLTSPGGP